MAGRFLLDTNIVIALFDQDVSVKSKLDTADEFYASSTVLGELYFGAMKSTRVPQNLARLEEFAALTVILHTDLITSRNYGEVRNGLRKKGRPIPENDIWIAAVAIQHDLTLLTRDVHFAEVDGLNSESC